TPRDRSRLARSIPLIAIAAAGFVVWFFSHRTSTPSATVAAMSPSASTVASIAPVPNQLAGAVQPSGDARWRQTRIENVERVTLEDGALRIHVRHQSAGERFLVDTPDGVIEVRGTTFEVEVFEGHTTRVAVDEGVVSWRLGSDGEVLLHAGES